MAESEDEYGLVMPFVVVASNGGPYDDESFVAGCRLAEWDVLLRLKPVMHANYEPTALVPQLDLLAMHHGYSIETEEWIGDGYWTHVQMTRGTPRDDQP